MFKRFFATHNVPTSRAMNDTFMLYKRISEQYANQAILNYVRSLVPKEILKKTKTEDK